MKNWLSCVFLLFIGVNLIAQEQEIITSDGVKLHIMVKGSGQPCLYIHGGPGSGSYWMEEFMGDSLEKRFKMIYLDQRGVGRSSSPQNGDYSLSRLVKDFEEVRTVLGIDKWHLFGHSFGGILQIAYAREAEDRILGMMCINCSFDMNESLGNGWLPKAIELLGNNVPESVNDSKISLFDRIMSVIPILAKRGEMWKIFFEKEENNVKMNNTYSKFDKWNSDLSETILTLDEYWQDFRPLTSEIEVPVLYFFGSKDWSIGPSHFKGVMFPNMISIRSRGGHMPFLENKPQLIKAIDNYLCIYFPNFIPK